ncbi:MAG TPA: helix-turn-helix domain-containing protein [Solirubrobacterales bacterium]|nr:helix-turn-helix domain-containing protein [Solirubrobacterales bacterium]
MEAVHSRPRRQLGRDLGLGVMSPQEMVTALRHPLRRGILRRLHEVGEARSPRELAAMLDCGVSEVTHHVAVLYAVKALALTDTVSDRGGVEHFYASTVEHDGGIGLVLIGTERSDEGR